MDSGKHIENSGLRPIAPVFVPKNNMAPSAAAQAIHTAFRATAPDFKPASPAFPHSKRFTCLGSGVYSSIHIRKALSSQDIKVDRFEWNNKSLAPYNKPRYRRLWLERKNAPKDLDHLVKGAFEETLPAEIRVHLYELLLCHDYVELAAKSNERYARDIDALAYHQEYLRKVILPGLRVLRLNSKIRAEAAPVFYGSNEFRFTNSEGWYIAAAWMHQIGFFNLQFLRKIAIHVPWRGAVKDRVHQEDVSEMESANRQLLKIGLRPAYSLSQSRKSFCIPYVRRTLEKYGKLESFHLVLPDLSSPEPKDTRDRDLKRSVAESKPPRYTANFILDSSKSEGLRVQLVRLHGGFTNLTVFDPRLAGHWRAESVWHSLSGCEQAVERGIELIDAPHDHLGCWPVPLEKGDEMLKIELETLRKILS